MGAVCQCSGIVLPHMAFRLRAAYVGAEQHRAEVGYRPGVGWVGAAQVSVYASYSGGPKPRPLGGLLLHLHSHAREPNLEFQDCLNKARSLWRCCSLWPIAL
ncbi:hypothetical protein SKAU_G00011500 [Synaphobranchus kaupii]|uniref:Uncharacterized protein n=1 Tax=Synaphobranchus kaupii TaxID=118154 RepID=A0A9Q1GBY4_SYNKA|nr:hypothetical protein SKAU_G00011500 [Synaphobranchus kaupii]